MDLTALAGAWPFGWLMIPAFGAANRFAGGGLGWERLKRDAGGPLRGHPVLYAGLFAIAAGALSGWLCEPVMAVPWALMGLIWAACRSIIISDDWTTPDSPLEIGLAFVRHALVALGGWLIGSMLDLPNLGFAVLIWAVAATLLAVWHAAKERAAKRAHRAIEPSVNRIVEWGQGLLLGLAILIGSLVSVAG